MPQQAPPRITVVRVGVLLPMFGTEAAGHSFFSWSPRVGVHQALRELNNKSDGVIRRKKSWTLRATLSRK